MSHHHASICAGSLLVGRLTHWVMVLLLLGGTLLAAAPPPLAHAANITVTTATDEDNGSLGGGAGISLREAVLYGASGDVISLPAGTYNLTISGGGEDLGKRGDLDIIAKTLTITGAGSNTTRIAMAVANTVPNSRDRVLDILSGSSLTISGVTISGGTTPAFGGGIRNQGTLVATGIVVRGNNAVTVDNNTVNGSNGGGIANLGQASATIRDSEVGGNTANRSGGGLSNAAGSTMLLEQVTVDNNVTTKEDGGGVENQGTLTVINSTFSANISNRNGGGIYNNGTATVVNSTLTRNVANADNRIGGNGGGAFNDSPTVGALTFRNSIIAGNLDLAGPPTGDFQPSFPDLNAQTQNTIVGNSNNLIGSRDGITNSTQIGTPGQSDIVNPTIALGDLLANGGPTRTHRPAPTSPAVDAANADTCTAAPIANRDQRTLSRPADGNGDAIAVCDIGSVEIRAALVVSLDDQQLNDGGQLDFGTLQRNSAVTRTLTLRNSGEARLVLDEGSISLPSGFSAEGFSETMLDPGQATEIAIRFDAPTSGSISGPFSFATNAPETPEFNLTLVAEVTTPPAFISVSENSIGLKGDELVSFGNTPVGTPVDRTFAIANTGDTALTISGVTVPTGFVVQDALPGSIAPGASANLTVRLLATAAGAYAGTLQISSNAVNANPFNLRLEGSVSGTTNDQLAVVDLFSASEVANGGSVNFGSTVVGTPLTRSFSLKNIGTVALTINAPVTLPADFSLVDSFATQTLQPGQSQTLTIRANASAVGTTTGTVSFDNTDSDENPFNFTVSATINAQAAQVAVSEGSTPIADNTGAVSFGSTTLGTPVVRTFTIRNTGGSALTIGSVTVPSGFTLVSGPAATVAPGATTTFEVRLNATAPGPFSGAVQFATNDTNANPFNFAVSGVVTNLPANIAVSVAATNVISGSMVDIGTTTLGKPISKEFIIRNTGNSVLEIDSINVPPGFTRNPDVVTAGTLAPGQSTTFVVLLDADTIGTYDGQATIRTNDPNQSDFAFTVTGTVNQPKLYLPMIFR